MTVHDISIIGTAFVISFSGFLINFIKKEGGTGIIFEQDAKTLLLFRSIIPAVLIVSVFIYFSRFGQYEPFTIIFLLGYLLIITGLIVRWIAVLSLGKAFTVKVSILKDQSLKTDGIYKKIRHPSYTGFLMYYLGLGLIMQNWICLSILTIAPLVVVLLRIKQEELVLSGHFGDQYKAYTQKTWKLFPYLF
jgi:protein-S-isoprenylcysteine O-methyltransferase Ste14